MPTCYGGTLESTFQFLYTNNTTTDSTTTKPLSEPPLPPLKFFIIVVGLLGGGESSSPSNTPSPYDGPNFPHITYEDNINLQHALCESLGIAKLFAYIGFSMGGQQAYHMAALYPQFVQNIIAIATSARTSWHNWAFLEGPRHALISAEDFKDGHYTSPAKKAMLAFSRVYAPWALSPQWFAQQCWKDAGFDTLHGFLDAFWSGEDGDANDRLAMLWTWQQGDISRTGDVDDGDLPAALGRIEAKCLIMPARTDQYFPPGDNEEEVKYLKNGEFSCIETVWGHVAGGGSGTKEDTEFIKKEVKRFLVI